jgi:hypothetical protein
MIMEEIKSIKTGKIELRKFGMMMGIILCFISGYLIWRNNENYYYCVVISVFFLVTGFIFPHVLRPIYKIWMSFAVLMGYVMTRVILIFLFYVICTPVAFLARILGNKFLELELFKSEASYWKSRDGLYSDNEQLKKQF